MNGRKIAGLAALAPLSWMVIGCSGSTATTSPVAQATTSGSAYMGSLANAAVTAYPLGIDGTQGSSAVMTTTDASGNFTVPQRAYVVHVKGGTYTEESTGATDSFVGSEMRAAFSTPQTTIVVSPFTEAIATSAQAMGGLTDANLSTADAAMTALLSGIDPMQTKPEWLTPVQMAAARASGQAAAAAPSAGNRMAFALGAESQMRQDYGIDSATSVATIMAQAASGDTIENCGGGAGDPQPDGTILAPQGDNCALTLAASDYASSVQNTSGITSLATFTPVTPLPNGYASATMNACTDRIALLEQNRSVYDARRAMVQADLQNPVTANNWKTVATPSTYGPSKAQYGTLTAPAACQDDLETFQREMLLSVENYWIDSGLNYCHHHIPGWLPPNTKKFRDSTSGSTSGDGKSSMTCTAQRGLDGSQKQSSKDVFSRDAINWQGMDCSNFTAWSYDFSGLTSPTLQSTLATSQASTTSTLLEMSGSIHQQACTVDGSQPGVLLNINSTNIAQMVQYLKPGDLLMVAQTAAQPKDAGVYAGDYKLAHVITWTGKHWRDLQAGTDKASYDLAKLGQPGSRLGGDFWEHGPKTEADLENDDIWLTIDSHFAGPAYRPFSTKTGWYSSRLVAVRRIIGAADVAADPVLSQYLLSAQKEHGNLMQMIKSPRGGATLYLDMSTKSLECYQAIDR